jgi:hypothetical protein
MQLSWFLDIPPIAGEMLTAVLVFLLAIVIGWVIYSLLRQYLSRWARATETQIDDSILRNIRSPILFLAILVGAYYSARARFQS